jgi:long-chain acyl-CoA synthetase
MRADVATIVELWARRVAADAQRPALAWHDGQTYRWQTWGALAAQVHRLAAALTRVGIEPGQCVAQLSENRYEWIVTDLALHVLGAVHVPIHPTLAGPQIAWQLRHCGARGVIFSTATQRDKLAGVLDELPADLITIAYESCPPLPGARPMAGWADLLAQGDEAAGQQLARRTVQTLAPSSLATILYTSGTTGEPKGVMLTQGNLAANALATVAAFSADTPEEPPHEKRRLNFLPLSHIFARTCDLYCWLVEGSQLALARSRLTVLEDCQAVQPTCLNGVPYFYDKVQRALPAQDQRDQAGALRAILGGAIRWCCSGGAALPPHLFDAYHAQGVPLLEGYGLTESSPVITVSTPRQVRRGSCGRPIPGVEVRIAEDGEILTRGPHVMAGYYRDPSATAAAIREGWLATGDLGRQDADGFVYITGRKKEILVTSSGKNIAPVYLESLLTQDPLIVQAVVVGDGRSYLSALLVLSPEHLAAELAACGLTDVPYEAALALPQTQLLVRQRIDRLLAGVSHHEQVRRFALLPRPLSIEAGELTPKLSLRRHEIYARYASLIEAMYAAP